MKLFVGVIIVAMIIFAVLLALNLIFSSDEEKTMGGFDVEDIPVGLTESSESEITSIIPTPEQQEKLDDWNNMGEVGKDTNDDEMFEPTLKVYVQNIPEYSHDSITMKVVDDALNSWEELNPTLKFEIINKANDKPTWFYRQNSDIQIKWVTNITNLQHLLGQTETTVTEYMDTGTITTQHEILIDIADVDCKGNPIFWNENTITDTIKHELGHALEINHSSDVNNLMYGYDGKYNFDTKGYFIPQTLGDQLYIGQRYVDEECFANSDSKYDPYG